MFSVRRIIGDDWGSTSHSVWLRERASLELDYAAYGEPDAIVGLSTDPWMDLTGDGEVDIFFDMQAFMAHLSAEDPEADRNNDSEWDFYDVQFFLADLSTALQPLSPTGRRNAEENPFGLAGYRHDAITGLYHVRHRVLDPEQGRWLQRDPAGFVDGGSLYLYAGGTPILASDPIGLWVVRRNGQPTATARTEAKGARGSDDDYDTIFELASELGLEHGKFSKWISSHPQPVKTVHRGDVSFRDISGSDQLCPDQNFSIPNTIFTFRTRLEIRKRQIDQMRAHKYYVLTVSGSGRGVLLYQWMMASRRGELFGIYLDAHSDGSNWWENHIMENRPISFSQMAGLAGYGLSVGYIAACDCGWDPFRTTPYFHFAHDLLMSTNHRDYYPDFVPSGTYDGEFIPYLHDDRNRIRREWGDPRAIR
ncbi:MAG: RHS repeat-associated core domain-containing protein [Phycisphaeraceae bacterium]|nr:RHS repeat-associated core domain-containing protein [Phycisphaeraceae bacterium]MCW5763079.1 RHS repeat-associated core domain-containing protein [Phycisphaeraceae bacterium]